ncbi:MAG: CvpA family protein [Sphingobium sp.]|nr:CvpA family protein [Sphingobium sp.]
MALLDIVVFLLIGGFGIRGFMSGFVREILSLCAVVAGIVAIRIFHGPVTAFLTPHIGSEYAAALLSFVFIFGTIYISTKLIASTASKQMRNVGLGSVDRVLGFGFGAVKGLLIATVGFVLFTMVYDALYGELSPRPDWMRYTRTYPLLNAAGEAMSSWVAQNSRDGGLIGVGEEKVKADGPAYPISKEKAEDR